jgi:hypothetical protein
MSVSWNRNDEDVLPIGHLAVQFVVSMLCWLLGGLVAFGIWRLGQLVT